MRLNTAQTERWAKLVGLDLRFHPRWVVQIRVEGRPVKPSRAGKPARFEAYIQPGRYHLRFEYRGKSSSFQCDGGSPWASEHLDAWKLGRPTGGDIVEMRGFRLASVGGLIRKLEADHDLALDLAGAKVEARAMPAGSKAKVQAWLGELPARKR
jgi:hypothetical protein